MLLLLTTEAPHVLVKCRDRHGTNRGRGGLLLVVERRHRQAMRRKGVVTTVSGRLQHHGRHFAVAVSWSEQAHQVVIINVRRRRLVVLSIVRAVSVTTNGHLRILGNGHVGNGIVKASDSVHRRQLGLLVFKLVRAASKAGVKGRGYGGQALRCERGWVGRGRAIVRVTEG